MRTLTKFCSTAVLTLLLAGCGVTVRETPFSPGRHAARDTEHPIQMFSTRTPECAYEEVGLLHAEKESGLTPWSRVVDGFVSRAREMGGDAVILNRTSQLASDVDGELVSQEILAGTVIRFEQADCRR